MEMINKSKYEGYTNKYRYSKENAREIWTRIYNRKYVIWQARIAYTFLCIVVAIQIAIGSLNWHYFVSLLIEGACLCILEIYKNNKINKMLSNLKWLSKLEIIVICYPSGVSCIIDEYEAMVTWAEIKNVIKTKNYYVLYLKESKDIIPIKKDGFLYSANCNDFEKFLFDSIENSSKKD